MTFVTIGLLIAGAISMSVPVLIHLLARQRRRPVEWAAMRFLIEALRKHRRRIRLEQILLLAVRCLLLLVLGAALARPLLEKAGIFEGGGLRVVMLVVDDGLASGVRIEGSDGTIRTALERSVAQAVEVVHMLGPGDAVGVITASRPARGLIIPPSSDHGSVIDILEGLEPAESPTDIAGALAVLSGALEELPADRDRTVAYLFSEFRRGGAPLDADLPALAAGDKLTLLAAPAAQDVVRNVQVGGIESTRGLVLTRSDEGDGQVTVRLTRSGGDLGADVSRVRLLSDDLPLAEPKVVRWAPGQSEADVEFLVDLTARGDSGVSLTAAIDDDALGPDNRRHLVLAARSHVRVAMIDRRRFGTAPELDRLSPGQWIRRALAPIDGSPMDVIDVDPAALEPVDLRAADAAILVRPDLLADAAWPIIRSFVDQGGLLLVVPPAEDRVHQWTDRLRRELSLPVQIAIEVAEHPGGLALADEQPGSEYLSLIAGELDHLGAPVRAFVTLPVDMPQTQAEPILLFADGSPMLLASTPTGDDGAAPSRGLVIYWALSPEATWTNLPAKPLMVPLVHELVRQGVGLIRTHARYAVGEQPQLGLGRTASRVVGPDGRAVALDQDGRPHRALARAGLYEVQDAAGQRLAEVAVNVDTDAGRPDPQPPSAVAEWLQKSGDWQTFDADDPGGRLRSAQRGAPLAGILLWTLLGLVVLESLLARWFSHAESGGRAAASAERGPMRAGGPRLAGGLR